MREKPKNAAERLADLGTEAKREGKDRVGETILSVKYGKGHEQQVRSLKGKKEELVSTYAYLINKDEKDEEVACLKPEGLKLMIIHRLTALMPFQCGKCLRDYCQERQENSKVTCLRCDQPACPYCFPDPVGQDLVYLCQPCKKVVKDDLGVNRLEEKHFLKSSLKRKEVVTLDENSDEEYENVVEDDEELDENPSQNDREREEAEGIENDYVPPGWRKKLPKKDSGKREKVESQTTSPKVCIHHKKGRCKFGLSGKKRIDGEWKKCPFAHPRVCEKLLTNGDRGKFGCRGNCGKFHPKMCYSSMNSKRCPHGKECRNGYHVRNTVTAAGNENDSSPRAGRQVKNDSKIPTSQKSEGPFFDVGQKVRQEILQVLKELNLSASPPPPPQPKAVTKEELKDALMALLQ